MPHHKEDEADEEAAAASSPSIASSPLKSAGSASTPTIAVDLQSPVVSPTPPQPPLSTGKPGPRRASSPTTAAVAASSPLAETFAPQMNEHRAGFGKGCGVSACPSPVIDIGPAATVLPPPSQTVVDDQKSQKARRSFAPHRFEQTHENRFGVGLGSRNGDGVGLFL